MNHTYDPGIRTCHTRRYATLQWLETWQDQLFFLQKVTSKTWKVYYVCEHSFMANR
jgi:hypothetical protein